MAAIAKRVRVQDDRDINSNEACPAASAPRGTKEQSVISPRSSPVEWKPEFVESRLVRPKPVRAVPFSLLQSFEFSGRADIVSDDDDSSAVNKDFKISGGLQCLESLRHSNLAYNNTLDEKSPIIVRPHAQAISQRAAEEFYEQAHTQGIPGLYVHSAVVEAHEWHRKWVDQDEEAHNHMRSCDAIQFYAQNEAERLAGARNPSLDDDDNRLNVKRPLTPPEIEAESNVEGIDVLRPIALRVHHPTLPQAATKFPTSLLLSCYVLGRSISPLTLPSMKSSSFSTEDLDETNAANVLPPPVIVVADEEDDRLMTNIPANVTISAVTKARDGILHELAISGGETTSDRFTDCLRFLENSFSLNICERDASLSEGRWLSLTKPSFFANLGENDSGDPMYTLGRMSFDMFAPTQLICSLQGTFNSVEKAKIKEGTPIPKALQEEVENGAELHTYE